MQQRNRRPCPWRSAQALGPRRRVHCPPILDDRPKRLVRRYYEEVLEHRRLDVLHRLVGRDFVGHDSGGAMMDRFDFITAVHMMGLVTLTHTPNPMGFLEELLERPQNEKAYLILPVGYPSDGAMVPDIQRLPLPEISVWK